MAERMETTTFTAEVSSVPLVAGCWSWGNRRTWGYAKRFGDADLRAAVEALGAHGVRCYDTAEVYSRGHAERLLGELAGAAAVVSTKFFPYPWRLTRSQFLRAVERGNRRLRMDRVHLYQLHHEPPAQLLRRFAGHLAAARRAGLVESVGTSNLSSDGLRATVAALAEHGERVSAHQTRYNLCDRRVERDGVAELCRTEDIVLLAHSALGQGLLSGRYRAGDAMPDRRPLNDQVLRQADPVIQLLIRYADRLATTPAAVALAWLRHRGAVPIVGVHDRRQAEEIAQGLGVALTDKMAQRLDAVTLPWRGKS
jgi:aryl-alcohol dehydrogenase-like predicted oxidoreductase